jgi:hypothetical protein
MKIISPLAQVICNSKVSLLILCLIARLRKRKKDKAYMGIHASYTKKLYVGLARIHPLVFME